MWTSLKSDLEELVNVVKEDTNVVLEKVADANEAKRTSAAAKEAERRMRIPETFTTALLLEALEEEDEHELERIKEFVENFKIDEKTEEISNLLEEYDELKEQFETLVPEHVQYEDFWERFFYRCDEKRIQHEFQVEEERARQARAKLVGSVSSFLGGAAKAVASGVAHALIDDDDDDGDGKPTSTAAVFGSAGRPPFVMNTAVDEDDDDEEELGWDDEEEDDEEEEYDLSSGVNASRSTDLSENMEQIEFKDEAFESLKEQLKQAMLERDQLHETVELQHKEIANLKKSDNSAGQIDELKQQLSEKQTELDTMKEDMESEMLKSTATDESGVNLAAKVKHLTGLLSTKELQLSKMQEALNDTKRKADGNETASKLQDENKALRQKLIEVAEQSTEQLAKLQKEVDAATDKIAVLTKELETTKSSLAASEKSAADQKTELEALRAASAATKDTHHAAAIAEEDAHSGSKASAASTAESGVKVEPTVVAKITADSDDDEEGWGDDWD